MMGFVFRMMGFVSKTGDLADILVPDKRQPGHALRPSPVMVTIHAGVVWP